MSEHAISAKPAQVYHSKPIVDEAFLEAASKLIAIRSTHDRPADLQQALHYVASYITQKNPAATIEWFEQNGAPSFLAYMGEERPERFSVLLNGHVDVVAGKDAQFLPYVHEGRLYGRGALDMKVSALVMAEAFCQVAPQVSYPLGLQIVTDEEIGGYNGAAYQFKQGVSADFFLTGEQSGNNVAVAAKGICWLRISEKGRASHGAYLWRGDNALLKLTDLVRKIHTIYPVPSKEAWGTTASVAQLKATSEGHFNRVPDAAQLQIDFRFVPGDPHFASKEAVRQFIDSLAPTAEVEFVTFEGGPCIELDHPLLRKLVTATETFKPTPVQTIRRHANSDARHLLADPGMRAVEYGVGGAFEHSDGEYTSLESVAIMRKALPAFLLSVDY